MAAPADAPPPADPPVAAVPEPAGPPITAGVRLRFDPMPADPGRTALTIEAFVDAKILATGTTPIDGSCKPASKPPAGTEEGAAFLQCDTASTSAIVKLVARGGKAALITRPTAESTAAYTTIYEVAPPAGVVFDL